MAAIDFQQYACVRDATRVSGYRDAEQILVDRSFLSGAFETESAPFKKNTIFEMNGPDHRHRRRAVSPLFTRSAASSYELEILGKSLRSQLQALTRLESGDGYLTIDLVRFTRLALIAVAARIIGIDSTNRIDRLLELADPIGMAADVKWSNRPHDEVLGEGHRAKAAFENEFLLPAISRRSKDAASFDTDLVSTLLASVDLEFDEAAALGVMSREAMIFLTAGVRTTAHAVSHTVHELWQHDSPPMIDLTIDYLRSAANEALRLHPPAPALIREATESTTLVSGIHVAPGDRVAIDLETCNHDREVFGADADSFTPNRSLPTGVHAYGLSFGAGPHVCLGKGLSVSASNTTESDDSLRTVVRVLATLGSLGLAPSQTDVPTKMDSGQDRWETYPVTLRADLLHNAWSEPLPFADGA